MRVCCCKADVRMVVEDMYRKLAPYHQVRPMCLLNTEIAHINETAPFHTVHLMVVKIRYFILVSQTSL